jgi:hypothetical protein
MIQLSKHLKAVNQGNNDSIVYTGDDGSTKTILFNGDGIYINGTEIADAVVGVDPTPVVRTNNPIVGTNSVNANIDALDAAIGADHTPVARTVGLTAVANSVNANIDALDAAIGTNVSPYTRTVGQVATNLAVNQNITNLDTAIGDDSHLTPVTRTKGQLVIAANTVFNHLDNLDAAIGADADLTVVSRTTGPLAVNSTIMTKFDMLDYAIGGDANITNSNIDVSHDLNICQNLNSLDVNKTVRTVKKTIGCVGSAETFKFATEDGTTEQPINLGAIVPALARIVDIFVHTKVAFDGITSLGVKVGPTTGTDTYIASVDMYTLNTINARAHAGALLNPPVAAASNVWVSATPGGHWDLNTVGQLDIYVTYIEVTNLLKS